MLLFVEGVPDVNVFLVQIDVLTEKIFVELADFGTHLEDLSEEHQLELFGQFLRLGKAVKSLQVLQLLLGGPNLLVLRRKLLAELLLEVGCHEGSVLAEEFVEFSELVHLLNGELLDEIALEVEVDELICVKLAQVLDVRSNLSKNGFVFSSKRADQHI